MKQWKIAVEWPYTPIPYPLIEKGIVYGSLPTLTTMMKDPPDSPWYGAT